MSLSPNRGMSRTARKRADLRWGSSRDHDHLLFPSGTQKGSESLGSCPRPRPFRQFLVNRNRFRYRSPPLTTSNSPQAGPEATHFSYTGMCAVPGRPLPLPTPPERARRPAILVHRYRWLGTPAIRGAEHRAYGLAGRHIGAWRAIGCQYCSAPSDLRPLPSDFRSVRSPAADQTRAGPLPTVRPTRRA